MESYFIYFKETLVLVDRWILRDLEPHEKKNIVSGFNNCELMIFISRIIHHIQRSYLRALVIRIRV